MNKEKKIKDSDSGIIKVADITLAQLSRGIYRSTATAFKELVSNAFDADATEVYINTNMPEFDYFSCSDNGTGMTLEKFIEHFANEGIGSSLKRKRHREATEKYHRPLIGRLGIGMMATGQLCHSFIIESHYYLDEYKKKGEAFRAEILLEDSSIFDKEEAIRDENLTDKDIEVGKWDYKRIDFDDKKIGFRIFSDDVRATLRRDFKKSIEGNKLENFKFNFYDIHQLYYDKSKKSIRDWNLYLETLWELSILCPLPYYGKTTEYPFNSKEFKNKLSRTKDYEKVIKLIETKQKEFLSYNFKLFFDGVELQRIVQLPTEKNRVNKTYFIDYNKPVFKSNLKFRGYLFSQIPSAVLPLELNGVQIRVRGVGIGGYDSTFLKYYKYIATVINKWVSGEIYVEEGIETALNIDRDSFNEHDEHYKRLQNVIHEKLDTVFDESKQIASNLSEDKRLVKATELKSNFTEFVENESHKQYSLKIRNLKNIDKGVIIDLKKKTITLNEAYKPIKKKKADEIMRVVELAYEMSKVLENDDVKRDSLFNKLLIQIFKKLL